MHNRTTAPPRAETSAAQHAPRHNRRAIAAIATTLGAAAVISGAFATPATAAPRRSVWDRVASCESSQRWHINSGNGYYGGLQFSAGTWAGYHGHRYARLASGATRTEQIEVARRVLASQGAHAWPVCGPRAGLTRHSGRATRRPLPQVAGRAGARTAHKTRHHHAARRHHAAQRHHHRATYRVRHGDTLIRIAHRFHVHGGWRALYGANRKHLANPSVLRVGQLLRLP
ncbi:MAG TPA: transglycosylase family protein [Jatrophihabitans sp.]|jgi:nucleoid-associated protein YgaU|nr:transglycosylase family protein [Jatrophihabitans sp.]